MKKFLSLVLSCVLLSSIFSFAEDQDQKKNKNIERYLGIARVITYTKGGKDNHYAYLDGQHKKIELEGSIAFLNLYDLKSVGRDPKQYRLISVEEFNGSNFEFGTNVYDYKEAYNKKAPRDYFAAQKGFLETKIHFFKEYTNFTAYQTQISNAKLTDRGVQLTIDTKLSGGLNYIDMVKPNRDAGIAHFRKLLGGNNIDQDSSDALARVRNSSDEELSKMGGYVFFVPYVITLEKIGTPDIVVYEGKYTHENNQLCYEYKVKLEGMEKLENIEVRDNNKVGEVIPLLEKDKPITIQNCVPYPDGKSVDIDIFVNPKKDNPKNEKTYDNNIYKVGGSADLEVVKIITEKEYPAGVEISIPVEVKNNSDKEFITAVTLDPGGKEKPIKLPPKGNDIVTFTYKTPDKSGNVTVTAEINKKRDIQEKDYSNNKKTATLIVKKDAPTKNGPCKDTVTWTEKDWRWETESYTVTIGGSVRPDGSIGTRTETRTRKVKKWYTFTYQATMKTTVSITDDKGQQKNKVKIKSGYGVKVDTTSNITVKQIAGKWTRAPKAKPSDPTTATVTTSWKVNKIHKQNQTIQLSGSSGSFSTPKNPSSETGAKVIYTDIDLPDGKHTMTVRVNGSYVDGKELCTSDVISIEIKGDMYEDYKIS